MKTDLYELEYLIEKFGEHGKITAQNQTDLIDSFIRFNPGQPLPNHVTDNFNMPLALASICSELLALKEKQ